MADGLDAIIARVIAGVNPRYTLTPAAAIETVVRLTLDAIERDVPGDLVECGVWMGGCSYAMLLAQRLAYGEVRRPVWMYDSFQGMSPPCELDGEGARGWYATAETLPKDRANNDYCIAPLSEVQAAIAELGVQEHVHLVPGWLHETLPQTKPDQVALLRIDCDWYEPVTCALSHLVPRMSPGAAAIVDDYHAWPGARTATHEYMATHRLDWPMNIIAGNNGVWMRKEAAPAA